MLFHGVELCCPACRADLCPRPPSPDGSDGPSRSDTADEFLHCFSCERIYPVLLGIPDLRLWPDPYIGLEQDRAKARMLANECAGLGFADSVELYYRVTAAVPPFQAARFARNLLAAADRSDSMVRALEASTGSPPSGTLLDVGCGTAPLLVSAAGRYDQVAGVDIAFRWLILAQKRLAEAGVSVPLVCACAEALPFRNVSIDRIVADATIEHFRDQPAGLRECHRVLRDQGRIFLVTPNRRSLGPDPHTGLPAGGWLPEALTAAYVRRRGGIPPRRRLLTDHTLRALLAEAGFTDIRVDAPDVPAAQRAALSGATRIGVDAYHFMKRVPGGATALRAIGPLLRANARKAAPR